MPIIWIGPKSSTVPDLLPMVINIPYVVIMPTGFLTCRFWENPTDHSGKIRQSVVIYVSLILDVR